MRERKPRLLGALLLSVGLAGSSGARTWVVDQNGQGDYLVIQEAIDAAVDGDEILVRAGSYSESLDLRGKMLDLIGEAGSASTIIDGGGSGSVLLARFIPTGVPTIRGFTFMNGNGTILRSPQRDGRYGGGVLVDAAAPRFEDCVFSGNVANYGGGAFSLAGAPLFLRCRFTGNDAGNGGGIGAMEDAGTRLVDCDIEGNTGVFGGGIDLFRSRLVVEGCRIRGNAAYEGGGIRIVDRSAVQVRVSESLIAANAADLGAGIHVWQGWLGVSGTTIAHNLAGAEGGSVRAIDADLAAEATIIESLEAVPLITCEASAPRLSCVVLWGPIPWDPSCQVEDRVLIADPRFCDPASGDYTLAADSPCLPGEGTARCGLIGAYGAGCLDPVAVRESSWGAIKALHR